MSHGREAAPLHCGCQGEPYLDEGAEPTVAVGTTCWGGGRRNPNVSFTEESIVLGSRAGAKIGHVAICDYARQLDFIEAV